jgi:Flp pilus assembly pilin Flp
MIGVLVFVVVVTSVSAFGTKTSAIMQNVSDKIGGAIGP